MALDSTKFDGWTKAKSHRDLAFRTIVWFLIASSTVVLAIRNGIRPIDHFFFFLDGAYPFVRSVDGIVAAIAVMAIMFRDLAIKFASEFGNNSKVGRTGMVVRRVASDLCLWVLAIYVAILTTAAFAFTYPGQGMYFTINRLVLGFELMPIIVLPFLLFVIVAYVARDARPSPIAKLVRSPRQLMLIHCNIALLVVFVHALSLHFASWRAGLKFHSTAYLAAGGLVMIGIIAALVLSYLMYPRLRVATYLLRRSITIPKDFRQTYCHWCGRPKVYCACHQRYCPFCDKQTTQHILQYSPLTPYSWRCHECLGANYLVDS